MRLSMTIEDETKKGTRNIKDPIGLPFTCPDSMHVAKLVANLSIPEIYRFTEGRDLLLVLGTCSWHLGHPATASNDSDGCCCCSRGSTVHQVPVMESWNMVVVIVGKW